MLDKSKKNEKSSVNNFEKDSTAEKKKFGGDEFDAERQSKEQAQTGIGKKMKIGKEIFNGLTKATSNVVQQAASILEEEVAAGIIAAKQVESNFINVDELRSGKKDEVIHRFRRDAHEVVDIFLDLAHAATKYVGDFAQRVITIRGGAGTQKKSEDVASGQLPTLKLTKSVKAGESAKIPMALENNSDKSMDEFSFNSTDLVDASGKRIEAGRITFNPAAVSIGPHKTEKVVVLVNIPAKTSPGIYTGLIQATKIGQLQAVLVVQVD